MQTLIFLQQVLVRFQFGFIKIGINQMIGHFKIFVHNNTNWNYIMQDLLQFHIIFFLFGKFRFKKFMTVYPQSLVSSRHLRLNVGRLSTRVLNRYYRLYHPMTSQVGQNILKMFNTRRIQQGNFRTYSFLMIIFEQKEFYDNSMFKIITRVSKQLN